MDTEDQDKPFDLPDDMSSTCSMVTEAEIIAGRASVKAEILAAIEPHRHRNQEPPFSAPELIVMAVLCSEEYETSRTKILKWILRTFLFYNYKALDVYLKAQDDGSYIDGTNCVVTSFDHGFTDWRAPLVDTLGPDYLTGTGSKMVDHNCNDFVFVPTDPGRVFLAKWLEPARKGTFPFLKLPAELRNTIYEMVLRFPASGFGLQSWPRGQLQLLEREHDVLLADAVWADHSGETINAPPMREVMALLRTNKQIYHEAMPVFYRDNFFYLEGVDVTTGAVLKLGSERVQHLSTLHLCLSIQPYERNNEMAKFTPAMLALTTVRRLKTLTIEMAGDTWLNMDQHSRQQLGRKTKFTKLHQIPGMEELAQIAAKAETLDLHDLGDDTAKAFITARVKEIKAGGEKPKKRRRSAKAVAKSAGKAGGSDEENGRPAKKQKKLVRTRQE